jgi:hypothetical protein
MAFDDRYQRDARPEVAQQDVSVLARLEHGAAGVTRFLATHAGGSYADGLYRIHDCAAMPKWTQVVEEAFPDFRNRLFCFGLDWLGRMFALDFARRDNGQWLVLMLEPGTGMALEIPVGFMEFHDGELVRYQNEALAVELFNAWRTSGGESPGFAECIGYQTPLFLNGSDTLDNLALTDLEVYWSIAGQLLAKVRQLPEGTAIHRIGLKD